MARIIHLRSDVAPVYISDLKHRNQSSVYEHGQDFYVGHYSHPANVAKLQAVLDRLGIVAVDAADVQAATVGLVTPDVSEATIKLIDGSLNALSSAQIDLIQDALAPTIVETGDFKLSLKAGVLKGLSSAFAYLGVSAPIVKIVTEDGADYVLA